MTTARPTGIGNRGERVMSSETALKSKWDEFLDAYLAYIADQTPEKERRMERLGRQLQRLDPKFSYSEFKKKVSPRDEE